MEWNPEQKSGLTPQEEVDKFGWLGALKLEEKRHRALLKAEGISFHTTQRAEHLRVYAVKHKIRNRRGEIPLHFCLNSIGVMFSRLECGRT